MVPLITPEFISSLISIKFYFHSAGARRALNVFAFCITDDSLFLLHSTNMDGSTYGIWFASIKKVTIQYGVLKSTCPRRNRG